MGMGCSIVRGVLAHDSVYLFELLAREGKEETTDEATVCCLDYLEV